jgi:hypothetical protein
MSSAFCDVPFSIVAVDCSAGPVEGGFDPLMRITNSVDPKTMTNQLPRRSQQMRRRSVPLE